MAATVSGGKVLLNNVSPSLTASALTTLLGTAPENLKISDLEVLLDAAHRLQGGTVPTNLLGTILI